MLNVIGVALFPTEVDMKGVLMKIQIPVSPGELIDKMTILQIKAERVRDPQKLKHINSEKTALTAVFEQHRKHDPEFDKIVSALKSVNEKLWVVEDDLRLLEAKQEFSNRFVELARQVYRVNDQRFNLKNEINLKYDSEIREEKSYPPYY